MGIFAFQTLLIKPNFTDYGIIFIFKERRR